MEVSIFNLFTIWVSLRVEPIVLKKSKINRLARA
ncbi:MAG: hypothetical protein RIT13_816, partial [Pseudomonadota bacterium]